ncbi:MAG: NCS2 family permease [Parasporobacterium sp.]|nr:NCS2 family permease [Parasporobacterium sp.]
MNRIFRLKENNTTAGREIIAGLTTFTAMAYIIFLNPVFLSTTGMDSQGVMIATCLAAAAGSILCAFISNKPFVLASGMGVNAFFSYTICGAYGYTWQQALALTFIAGSIFFILIVTPVGKVIIKSIPVILKHSISAGIGLFIAVIGLLDSGLISLSSGLPALGDLSSPAVIISLVGLVITTVLVVLKVKGALFIGMVATVVINIIAGLTALPESVVSMPSALANVFCKMDFAGLIPQGGGAAAIITLVSVVISLTLVDMFDTLGFLVGAASSAGMLDKDGNMPGGRRVLAADAAATVIGSVFGTSTVTCFAESEAGIAAGGRTGLTSFVAAVCFALSCFFAPITGLVTSSATAPVMIIVGLYLFMDVKNIDFKELDNAIPAFLTIIMIPLAYSISTGIALGFISYVISKLAARKWKELNPAVIVLAVIFVIYLVL